MLYCSYVKNNGAFVMKIKFLLLGTSLSLIPTITFAQCVATQDCETLGYTETSCNGGKGVKCPFGNWWACIKSDSEIEQQFCDKYGFQYTCSGTGYSKGVGTACNGKYTACTCADGYEWKDGVCSIAAVSCTIGTLYYSNGKCYNQKVDSQTLLGVVIMEKINNTSGWIITINPIKTNIKWSNETVDIPGLTNYTSIPSDIQASCTNTDTITTYGNSYQYPAAWAAKDYSPRGTPFGKSWCLPSGGLLNIALNNSTNFAKINSGITTAGGTIIGNAYRNYEYMWSSSEYRYEFAWLFVANANISFEIGHGEKNDYIHDYMSVRPVLAF